MAHIQQSTSSFDLRRLKLACGAEALATLIRGVVAAAARHGERRRERAQLLALSDRELRDIGITRVDAIREATKKLRPWWRRHCE